MDAYNLERFNNLANSVSTPYLDAIPSADEIMKQVMSSQQSGYTPNTMPVLSGSANNNNITQAQSALPTNTINDASTIINPYADRTKSYQYKRFYGNNQNGFDAVDMKSMGLKGQIWSGNSVPFIRKDYADAMHWLDDELANNGVKIIYTSAMGGQHKQSSSGRGHGDGAKLDAQGIIPPNLYRKLYNRRYFGEGTGAVGYEVRGSNKVVTPDEYDKLYRAGKVTMANGNHYDFSNKYASEYLAQERGRSTNPLKRNDDTVLAFNTPQNNNNDNIINESMPLNAFAQFNSSGFDANSYAKNLLQSAGIDPNTLAGFSNQSTSDEPLPADMFAEYAKQQKEAVQRKPSEMEGVSTNLITNFINNAREIGTGLNYVWANAPELIANAPKAVQDYAAKYNSPQEFIGNATIDVVNMILEPYNIDLRKMEGRDALDVARGVIAGAYAHPLDFLLDFVSLGGAGVAKKLIAKVPGLAKVAKAGDIEKALAAEQKAVTQNVLKAQEKLDNVNKLAKEANISTEDLFRAAEHEGRHFLPEGEKVDKAWNALKEASDDFDELARVYSPSTYVGKERTAIIQKILRDREFAQPGVTYEQIRREVTPYLDELDKVGIDEFAKKYETLAEQNHLRQQDIPALEVMQGKRKFDRGDIMPITHMMAEVNKSVGKEAIRGARAAGDIEMAGRFSNRAYGNATYKAIAEQWAKPQEYLTNLMDSYLEGGVAKSILRGEFAPVASELGKSAKASYLDRALLEQGKLKEALNKARPEPLGLDDIAIDNDVLAPLKSQLQSRSNGLSGFMKDVGGTVRGTMLSSLGYLGPNFITGATNALLNSGPMIVADIVSAIKSQGNLAKQLGAFRYPKKGKVSTMPGLRQIDQINNFIGNRASLADRTIQNTFAEIAAHANLRQKGIPFGDRLNAINQMDKMKLGEIITDTKKAALINSTRNLLPDFMNDLGAIANPFWKWTDTATQASFRMLEKSPLLANVLLTDIAANIGFDKEMQNRMNLHVDIDKPYVTFKFDPKSNQMKTISAEFVPITTSIKFADMANWGRERPAQWALFGPMINALGGLDQYGRPMKRPIQNSIMTQAVGTKRFQSGQGQPWHEINGQGDEILNTALKQLIGPVNLYNKTIAPLVSSVISPTGQYYQPYGMATFGGFDRANLETNPISAGNPTRGRTAQDVINAFTGIYEQDYHPEYDIITPTKNRSLTRQFMRGQLRLQGEGY